MSTKHIARKTLNNDVKFSQYELLFDNTACCMCVCHVLLKSYLLTYTRKCVVNENFTKRTKPQIVTENKIM